MTSDNKTVLIYYVGTEAGANYKLAAVYADELRKLSITPRIKDSSVGHHYFEEADAIIFIIPEYNGSYPGVLKTSIDYYVQPDGSAIKNKPVLLVGTSGGNSGNMLGISHFSDVMYSIKANLVSFRIYIRNIGSLADFSEYTERIQASVKELNRLLTT